MPLLVVRRRLREPLWAHSEVVGRDGNDDSRPLQVIDLDSVERVELGVKDRRIDRVVHELERRNTSIGEALGVAPDEEPGIQANDSGV
jgi:hypothetical protein